MRSTLIYFFIALILVTLGACQPTGKGLEGIVDPNLIIPEAGLTPKERNIKALGLLQEGKAKEARVELEASLAELPANKNSLAQNLISQIDGDPGGMLGSKYFKHEIVKGESLSIIAEQFLGDKFKFYVLARYNDMDNPAQLKYGDVIKVPGKKPPETQPDLTFLATRPDARPDVPPEPDIEIAKPDDNPPEPGSRIEEVDLLAEADEMVKAGNYDSAIIHLKKGLKQFPDTKVIKDNLAGVYVRHGGKLSGQHKYGEARSALQQAAILDPENNDISGRLAEADRAVEADSLFLEGLKYFKKDAVIEAYESYEAALKVWSAHDPAQIEKAKISPRVADKYYREGQIAFQRHDLKVALEMFNKALEVDPNHGPAKLRRQQTIDLINNLKVIPAASEQVGPRQNARSD